QKPGPASFTPAQVGIEVGGGQVAYTACHTSVEAHSFGLFQDDVQDTRCTAGFEFRGRVGDYFNTLNLIGRNGLKRVGTAVDSEKGRRFSVDEETDVRVTTHGSGTVGLYRDSRYIGKYIL